MKTGARQLPLIDSFTVEGEDEGEVEWMKLDLLMLLPLLRMDSRWAPSVNLLV